MAVAIERLLLMLKCDCFVEIFGLAFCRVRKESFGAYMDGRAEIARVDVWSARVYVRDVRRNMIALIRSLSFLRD